MMLHAYEQHHLAGVYYEQARQLDPRAPSWAYLAGVVQAELGDRAAAVRSCRRALSLDPSYLPARVRLGEALLADGDLTASRAEFEAIVRRFPELALAHYGLGRVATASGDSMAAATHYERAVELAPQFGRAHYALALAFRDIDRIERAERHLEAYRRFGPRRPTVPDPLLDQVRTGSPTARELISQAARAARAGQVDEAIALNLKAIAADPSAAQAHVNLIALYGRLGRTDAAERHYRSALQLESHVAQAHYNYGVLQASAERHAEAADAFRRTLEIDPFHASAHNNLAALLARQGEREDAAGHFRQALSSDPQHQGARLGLAAVLVAQGRPREAIEHLQRLLVEEGPETPRHKLVLATAWFAAGDVQKAVAYAEEAYGDARRRGQAELADVIEREVRRFEAGRR
jgi:tetratricopeptide (TPR) repeat protein